MRFFREEQMGFYVFVIFSVETLLLSWKVAPNSGALQAE
jgi:hypothetical protein